MAAGRSAGAGGPPPGSRRGWHPRAAGHTTPRAAPAKMTIAQFAAGHHGRPPAGLRGEACSPGCGACRLLPPPRRCPSLVSPGQRSPPPCPLVPHCSENVLHRGAQPSIVGILTTSEGRCAHVPSRRCRAANRPNREPTSRMVKPASSEPHPRRRHRGWTRPSCALFLADHLGSPLAQRTSRRFCGRPRCLGTRDGCVASRTSRRLISEPLGDPSDV